jgi:Ca2+-transporting ATPase
MTNVMIQLEISSGSTSRINLYSILISYAKKQMNQLPKLPFAHPPEKLLDLLKSDPERGLPQKEVLQRQATFGLNQLKRLSRKPMLGIFLEQFLDPVIYVLLFANVLAFSFSEWLDGIAISIVILITVLIGFFMELQAIRSMEALRRMSRTTALCIREGQKVSIPAEELVPGDMVLLEMGDVVPADARILSHQKLAIKEAILTGESDQVEKGMEVLPEDTVLADRTNMIYKGTLVTRGTARALIVATGFETELGKISRLTQQTEKDRTPLQKKLSTLSKRLIGITLVLAFFIAFSGYTQGKDIRLMIETAIALAVAAIPEGLPIVATIALARGMLRLAKRQVIIKRLDSVQTLGETGIICTDKTGTLTENEMTVHALMFNDHFVELPGNDLAAFLEEFKSIPAFEAIVRVGILCNDAEIAIKRGDPIEIALLEFADKAGYSAREIRNRQTEYYEMPFDTERKMMATINKGPQGGFWVCVKGALETILEQCSHVLDGAEEVPLTEPNEWLKKADRLAEQGMRVLAFAYCPREERPGKKEFVEELVLLGLVGFIDPPRKDIASAIEMCNKAGIKVVMVTGDHPVTAQKIAEEIGLLKKGKGKEEVIVGKNLKPYESLEKEEIDKLLKATVFARVTPAQKLDLISLYQNNNNTVGMTGDGVNDAPALKKADIGIAMGIRGTDAAKEVADVILQDDGFTAIEMAIRQGRAIFENIRNFVVYLLSCNLAEIIAVAMAFLLNLPSPLLPLQILFLNLVTDVFPALALGMGEGASDIMEKPPKRPDEPLLSMRQWMNTFAYAAGISLSTLGIILFAHFKLELPADEANNMAFYTLILGQLLNVFNLPANHISVFKNEVTRNPWVWRALILCVLLIAVAYMIPVVREVLMLVPLEWYQIGLIGLFGLGSLLLTQVLKRLY